MRTWGHEDMGTWGHEDMGTWGHEDMRTWVHEDMRTWDTKMHYKCPVAANLLSLYISYIDR